MEETETVRLVTQNRLGLCCNPYFTFHVSGSSRDRGVISFSVGKLLVVNGLEHLQGKGTMNLLYKLTIYEMGGRIRRKNDDRYHGSILKYSRKACKINDFLTK